ncbi:excalibur calcium-binding domain-containing protein [Nocardia sp. NPDC060249]|uniref:excalibur calcium-binding domain-containing protein n=1 Tax=Nocardia sp. NPDC060249 TaxID=3347082 RepID=UPI003666B138
MTRPIQPPDPWARPPRQPEKKRRWPLLAGIGVAGVLGLSVVAGLGDDNPSPAARTSPTSTTRIVESSTTTKPSTTTATPTTTASTVLSLAPATTIDPPPAPIAPTTTIAPPPPVIVPVPTTVDLPAPRVAAVPQPEAPAPASAYYKNCAAAKAAGAAPLHTGDPGYRSGLDRDGDGVACE